MRPVRPSPTLEAKCLNKKMSKEIMVKLRNATFHFQADPLNEKLIDFLEKKGSEVSHATPTVSANISALKLCRWRTCA
jgi:hypothetical protein